MEGFLMSDKIIIYQKPTCSKCKATISILKDSNEEFENINYYEVPLTSNQLRELRDKLGLSVRDMLRSDEKLARSLHLADRNLSDDELIDLMVENPDLIQRPIVVRGNRAVLCRPPENVMKLL
jgi:arsenate reductase